MKILRLCPVTRGTCTDSTADGTCRETGKPLKDMTHCPLIVHRTGGEAA